jgi:hypothetical protein
MDQASFKLPFIGCRKTCSHRDTLLSLVYMHKFFFILTDGKCVHNFSSKNRQEENTWDT